MVKQRRERTKNVEGKRRRRMEVVERERKMGPLTCYSPFYLSHCSPGTP